ncbi:tetratricopeptide repeat protein [bacterium]|nr:tetratricopeptide repeat protein [bacterium]
MPESKPTIAYQRGLDAFARGDFAEAERHLLVALPEHQDYANIYAMLGAIQHLKGRFGDTIKLLAKALEINPNYTEAKVNLMVLLQDLGRYDRSHKILKDLQRGEDALPQSPDPLSRNRLANAHAVTGDMYMAIDVYDAAIRSYEAALALRPSYIDIRLKLARAFHAAGDLQNAEIQCRTCLSAFPEMNEARVYLGTLLEAQGRRDDAIEAWRQVLALEPANDEALRYMQSVGAPLPDEADRGSRIED